jgi:hypothetical protein
MLKLFTDVGDLLDGASSATLHARIAATEVARTARTVRTAARVNTLVSLVFLGLAAGVVVAYVIHAHRRDSDDPDRNVIATPYTSGGDPWDGPDREDKS